MEVPPSSRQSILPVELKCLSQSYFETFDEFLPSMFLAVHSWNFFYPANPPFTLLFENTCILFIHTKISLYGFSSDILIRKFRYELLYVAACFRCHLLQCKFQPLPHDGIFQVIGRPQGPTTAVEAEKQLLLRRAASGSGLSPRASLPFLPERCP